MVENVLRCCLKTCSGFSPFCVIFWRVFAKMKKNENDQNPEPTQPKLFPQVEFLGKGLV